jgi:sucrose-6-phosphate hydrolase SacC (GH32 family)
MAVDGDPANTKWVFTAANGRYLVGDFDGAKFVPDSPIAKPLASEHYYAVQTFSDLPDGRRIQLAWLNGLAYPEMPFNQQMSAPVELSLRSSDDSTGLRLCGAPIAELNNLRMWTRSWENVALTADVVFKTPEVSAAGYDVSMTLAVGAAARIELSLCGFSLVWDRATQLLNGRMSVCARDGAIRFRALVDRASIEVFAEDGEAIMVSGGEMELEHPHISVIARGSASLTRLEVSGLRSAWVSP